MKRNNIVKLHGAGMDNFAKAIKAASNLSAHEGADFKVVNHHPDFLSGSLYVVGFKNSNGESLSNYVYIQGDEVTVCKNPAMLNEMVSRKSRKTGVVSFIESIGGVAGIIGLLITCTIIFLLVRNPEANVPQALSAALTTILGFYFGTKASK